MGFRFRRWSSGLSSRSPDGPVRENADYWRKRAEEARMKADQMRDPADKRMMLEVAESYDLLAESTRSKKSN
jgi:hypothetical protein